MVKTPLRRNAPAGTQRTVADSRIAAAVALAAASATAPAAAPAASSGVPVLSGQDKDNVKSFLKLSAVLDHTSGEEFQLMSRAEADDCFKVYDMRLGGAPPDRPSANRGPAFRNEARCNSRVCAFR